MVYGGLDPLDIGEAFFSFAPTWPGGWHRGKFGMPGTAHTFFRAVQSLLFVRSVPMGPMSGVSYSPVEDGISDSFFVSSVAPSPQFWSLRTVESSLLWLPTLFCEIFALWSE